MKFSRSHCGLVLVLTVFLATTTSLTIDTSATSPPPGDALRLGALFDYSGPLEEFGPVVQRGVELAIRHVNEAGGVWGHPVELVTADGATEAAVAVSAAHRLVEHDRIHALIGPLGSAATLAVAREVTIAAGVPIISPTATAPQLTDLDDDGFVFRATASDAAQGPVLARLASAEGFDRLAVFYRDDAYGRGLADAFEGAFRGEVTARVALRPGKVSYLAELRRAARGEPQALVAITFPYETEIFMEEAREHGLFDRFFFSDALALPSIAEKIGPAVAGGIKGTGPASAASAGHGATFAAAHEEAFGEPPSSGMVAAAYDAAICLCLAAERSGRGGTDLRDALYAVCGGRGEDFAPGGASIAAAFTAIRDGREIDYDGASGDMDWNAAGDITRGNISIWQFVDGTPTSVEVVAFRLD